LSSEPRDGTAAVAPDIAERIEIGVDANDGGGSGAPPPPAADADVKVIESEPDAEKLLTLSNELRWSRVKRAVGGDGSRSSMLPVGESSTPPACDAPRSMRRRGGAPRGLTRSRMALCGAGAQRSGSGRVFGCESARGGAGTVGRIGSGPSSARRGSHRRSPSGVDARRPGTRA